MNGYTLKRWWNSVPFALALICLAVLVWTAWLIVQWPYDGVEKVSRTGRIEIVNPTGPAAEVLEAGDIIVAIDGAAFNPVNNAYAARRAGDTVRFTVLHRGQVRQVDIHLEASPLPTLLRGFSPWGVALAFWIIGTGVVALAPADSRSKLFFLMCLVWSGVISFGLLSLLGHTWAINPYYILLWFYAPLGIQFHLTFPEAKRRTYRPALLIGLYTLSILGSVPFLGWESIALTATSWYNIFYSAARLYLAASMLVSAGLLLSAYRNASMVKVRQQVRLVTLGGCLALVPFIALNVLPDLLWRTPLISYSIGFLFLLAIPLGYGYAIVRHQLLKLDRFVSRGAALTLVFAILVMLYLGISAGLSRLLPAALLAHPLANTLIVLLMAAVFGPLRQWLQNFVDWVFYGGWYDYSTAVEKITAGLEHAAEVDTLARTICQRIQATLRVESSCLLVADPTGDLVLRGSAGHEWANTGPGLPRSLARNSAIVRYLTTAAAPVEPGAFRELARGWPILEPDHGWLTHSQARLFVPIQGRGALLGILILGPRSGGEIFDADDLKILQWIARQAGARAQNIQLNHELERHAFELTRLHREVVGAREEERKRLARELHDNVIQSLIMLNLELTRQNNGQPALLQSEIHQIVDGLRNLCRELRPPALDDLGLVPAIRSRLRELANQHHGSLQISFRVEGNEEQELPEEVSLCLFRILQEALANVQKHAQAKHVFVKLHLHPEAAQLLIQDDGRGFRVPARLGQLLGDNHFGLVGLRERLEMVRGSLEIDSAPGRGTLLQARLPLLEAHALVSE